jgi:hypothetical protein
MREKHKITRNNDAYFNLTKTQEPVQDGEAAIFPPNIKTRKLTKHLN